MKIHSNQVIRIVGSGSLSETLENIQNRDEDPTSGMSLSSSMATSTTKSPNIPKSLKLVLVDLGGGILQT